MTLPNNIFLEDWNTLERLRSGASLPLSASQELAILLRLWHSHDEHLAEWRAIPASYCYVAGRFLSLGVPPLAREVAEAGLAELAEIPGLSHELLVDLRRTLGRALTKTDNTLEAQALLLQLHHEGYRDEETVGSLASTYKDQAFAHPLRSEPWQALLEPALQYYREAYASQQQIWTGINVATLELLSGNRAAAEQVASEVKNRCQAEPQGSDRQKKIDHYWRLATLGEVSLIEGNLAAAGEYYLAAAELAGNQFGMTQTTRRHAAWLLQDGIAAGRFQPEALALLDEWLPLPQVIVFAGHLLDSPQRPSPRFPPQLETAVRETLRDWLRSRSRLIGFSSAACGADILFQEALQELGGESRIILPYDEDQFAEDSVVTAGESWLERYRQVLRNASQVITASPQRLANQGLAYHYANLMMQGWAIQRAAQLQHGQLLPTGLVVWDGQPGDGFGGTASAVQQWQRSGMSVHQVNLAGTASDSSRLPIVVNPPARATPGDSERAAAGEAQIMSILFADVVNFSRMNDEQMLQFMQHVIKPIADIIQGAGSALVTREDRGDGFKLVFNHVRGAGQTALSICDFIRQGVAGGEWSALGLPANLNLRIGLHAGPVFGYVHPLTRQQRYTGSHVVRAARLEPKTPPGEVYASEAFAALVKVHGVTEFRCQYVKQLQLAKYYGTFPTYVLRRQSLRPDLAVAPAT